MGFFKKEVFENIGKYPVDWPQTQDFWGRSEDWYDSRVKSIYKKQLNYSAWVPLFVPVWNDPRGGYAFIRGDKRYGYYVDAVSENGLYYKLNDFNFYSKKQQSNIPASFVDVSCSDGWNYLINNNDQVKYPQNKVLIEGPVQDF